MSCTYCWCRVCPIDSTPSISIVQYCDFLATSCVKMCECLLSSFFLIFFCERFYAYRTNAKIPFEWNARNVISSVRCECIKSWFCRWFYLYVAVWLLYSTWNTYLSYLGEVEEEKKEKKKKRTKASACGRFVLRTSWGVPSCFFARLMKEPALVLQFQNESIIFHTSKFVTNYSKQKSFKNNNLWLCLCFWWRWRR